MDSKVERLEKNVVKLSFNIPPERAEEGMNHSYNKNKASINLPGFRKGKAPRAMIERQYGPGFLLDDAIDYVFPDAYAALLKEHNISPVSAPQIEHVDYDKEEGISLTITVSQKPEVVLGQYKEVPYEDYEIEVIDSEIDAEIEKDREKNSRIVTVERPAQNGDTAVIDFEGFIDGVPFEGGKGEGFELVLGSNTFIDTFEQQLIGKSAGDDVDVSVTFPDDYNSKELAGKPALFKVNVKEITHRELPELDDDFAQDVSEFDTFIEYKESIKEKLIHQKEHKKDHDIEDSIIKTVSEAAEIDIPEAMIERQTEQMLYDFEGRLHSQGMDFNTFLNYTGQTVEALKESYRESAERNVRARLVLEKIADTEGIAVTEADIEDEIKRIAEVYRIPEGQMREMLREEDMKGLETDIKTQRALKIIMDSAVAAPKQ